MTDLFDAARGGNWDDAVDLAARQPAARGRRRAGDAARRRAARGRARQDRRRRRRWMRPRWRGGRRIPTRCRCRGAGAHRRGRRQGRSCASSAMELAAARFAQEQAKVALAAVESMRARLADDGGRSRERARSAGARRWWWIPGCLPAARAIRRDVARRGDLALAVDATEAEAACLRVPEHRVHALLLAAALAEDAARGQQRRRRRPRAGLHLPAPGDRAAARGAGDRSRRTRRVRAAAHAAR